MSVSFNIKQLVSDNYSFIKAEFIMFIAALIAPTVPMLILMGVLIVADTLTGVWGSIKIDGWKSITSRKLAKGDDSGFGLVPKLILYPLGILTAQAMESQFPSIPFMKTTGFIFMSIEGKSLAENFYKISGLEIHKYIAIFVTRGKSGLLKELSKVKEEK